MSTSHAPAYAEDGMPKERYRLYHEEKARGGLALSMFGGSSAISTDSPPPFGQIGVGDDHVIPWLESFAEGVHRHGCATMIQITHMGRRTGWSANGWLPIVAPSAVREPAHRSFPKAMDRDDIERIIKDFAAAAGRARQGGIDGCELAVLGHLAGQFWSPAVNRRTDGYGGSLANRARFTLETLEAMREPAPDRILIGMRFTMDELVEDDHEARERDVRLARPLVHRCLRLERAVDAPPARVAFAHDGSSSPRSGRVTAFHRFAAPGSVRRESVPSRSSHASTAAHAASHLSPAPASRSSRSSSTASMRLRRMALCITPGGRDSGASAR